MNGKPSKPIEVESLDYREIAKPLTFALIKEDIDAIYLAGGTGPKKLILWEHQVDWLVKAERDGEPLENLNESWDQYIVGRRYGKAAGLLSSLLPRPAIWGVPVESHRPLIENDLRRAARHVMTYPHAPGSYHFTTHTTP